MRPSRSVSRGERLDDALDLLLVDAVEHRHAELLLAGEVGVDRALGEAGPSATLSSDVAA